MTVDEIERAIEALSQDERIKLEKRFGWAQVRPKGQEFALFDLPDSERFYVEIFQDAFYLTVQYHLPTLIEVLQGFNFHKTANQELGRGYVTDILGDSHKIKTLVHTPEDLDSTNYQLMMGQTLVKSSYLTVFGNDINGTLVAGLGYLGEENTFSIAIPSIHPLNKDAELSENYIRENIVNKMYNSLLQLVLESVYIKDESLTSAMRRQLETLTSNPDIPGRRRGGNTASKHKWTSTDRLRLAITVKQILPLWQEIIRYFEKNQYDSGCPISVKQQQKFKDLSGGLLVPDDLLTKVLARKNKSPEDLRPLAFALSHARQIIDIPYEYSYSTLKAEYKLGRKLLKKAEELHTN